MGPSLFLSDPITFCIGVRGQYERVSILVDLVLEDVEVVCGCYGDDVFMRVPRRVKDFLAEV